MIQSLTLSNFKCFEDHAIEFGPLNLFAGLNGMGKSTMLQALLLLRQSYQQSLLQNIGLALNGDLVRIGTAKDALYEGAKEEKIGFELALADGAKGKWSFNYIQEADVIALDHYSSHGEPYKSCLFGDNFHYLQAERIGPRRFFEMSDFQVRQHRQIGTRGEYSAHFLSVFGDIIEINNALAYPDGRSNKLRDQVEAWMEEISPGTRLHVLAHKDMDLVNLEYTFVTGKYASNSFRSTNVGFGITYTLPVLVALLSSTPGSLVLLENPEAHLHPRGQVRLGELMALAATCGAQVFVETHSDHILNGIRLAVYKEKIAHADVRLYFFDRVVRGEEGRISITSPKIDSNGRIDQWPEGFFDVWDKCLEALLEPKSV